MNFFSSDAFLGAVAVAFFPGRSCAPCEVAVDGRAFRVLRVGRSRVVHDCRFLDYLEPLQGSSSTEPRPAGFLRRVRIGDMRIDRGPDALPAGVIPGPYVRWDRFESYDAFKAMVDGRSKSTFQTTARKARKLAREVGEVRFVRHTREEQVLERVFEWKSLQYQRTGLPDLFSSAPTRDLFRHLLRCGAVELAALYAGDRLVAAHLGPRFEGRFYYWVPVYDAELSKLSPGNVLNHELMRDSFEAGDKTFDLLLGGEAYKWRYATDCALIGPLGQAPAVERVWNSVRSTAKERLGHAPAVWGAMQRAKRYLRERELLR